MGKQVKIGRAWKADAGMVTAEMLVIAPLVAALLVAALWAIGAGITYAQVGDAARHGARALARGESDSAARQAAGEHAPRGSTVEIKRMGNRVDVQVHAPLRLRAKVLPDLGRWRVRGHAVAEVEQP
jgi:Flp pilus assembly protein TadG